MLPGRSDIPSENQLQGNVDCLLSFTKNELNFAISLTVLFGIKK